MYSQKDWIKAVTTLMKKTSDGDLSWETTIIDRGDLPNNDNKPGAAYFSSLNERFYRAYTYQQQQFSDEYEEFYWVNCHAFEVLDRSPHSPIAHKVIDKSPDLAVIKDLLSTIERSIAFQRGALDGLL